MIHLRIQTAVQHLNALEVNVKTVMWAWFGPDQFPFLEMSKLRRFPAGPECPEDITLWINGGPAPYLRYEQFFAEACWFQWANFAGIPPVFPNIDLIEYEGILNDSQDSAPSLLSLTESATDRLLNSSVDSLITID